MKKRVLFIISILLIASTFLFAQLFSGNIIGKWKNPTGEKIMEIYKQNDLYYGKIVECTDHEVPLGTMILKGFKFVADENEWKGEIYLPKQGKSYPGTLTLKDEKTMLIEVSIGFMSRTKEWKRVEKSY